MNLTKFFNKQNLKKYTVLIEKIHSLEEKEYKNLPNEEIAAKLLEIKKSNIKDKEKILHAMALAKKASNHVLNMSYYDVQLMGALALVDGCISEMKTGEGKTLTCSAAVAANFVLGYSTHVATANEYLATRDHATLEPLYSFLGISSGSCTSQMEKFQKKISYQSDVVYSTAQELGFDFLRDNLVHTIEEKIQPLDFSKIKAIIDEADFILIDEARTPLIISGEAPVKDLETYQLLRLISQKLQKMAKAPSESFMDLEDMPEGDFWVDEKYKTVHLSESGYISLEKLALEHAIISISPEDNPQSHLTALYQNHNSWIIHEVLNALKAEHCYIKDKDYIVHNEEIVIIDQNTGRLSEGRSWSNGLHQAIETKENVKINPETMTLGTISVQNFFRNYLKISGMSGTVMNSSEEFESIYNTTTISIPTNRKMIRKDHHDKIYLSMQAKYLGIIEDISARHNKGQPILIGTTSVAESEIISSLLTQKNISHNVLNAKNNFREAQIIAQAGQPFAVTVSTSMAGRGTDIILGGNKEALLNILNEQRVAIQERRAFFTAISEQLQLNNPENEESEVSENEVQSHYDHIDHNEIQEQINYLYDPQHISGILNQGLPFINHHLNVLEHNILKQLTIVETSQKDWREQVMKVGGLFVLGSSRNESRRIDDQLRGRAGRQGDPGESNFYLSIEDPWVNIFGKNPIFQHLAKTLPPNESISSPMVTKAFAKAQASIEAHHFNSRKDTFQYDSIADEGRRQFLKLRNLLLSEKTTISGLLKSTLFDIMTPLAHPEFLDFMDEKLKLNLNDQNELLKIVLSFPIKEIQFYCQTMMQERGYINMKEVKPTYFPMIEDKIEEFVDKQTPEILEYLNSMSLRQLDKRWTDHLVFVEDGRQNVAFSSLAQKQPLQEFKKICFSSFSSMFEEFRQQIVDDFISILQDVQNQQNQFIQNIEVIPEENSITQ